MLKILEISYRGVLKPILDSVLMTIFGGFSHCSHEPSCGRFFFLSIQRHGILRGSYLGMRQLLRCWGHFKIER